MDEVSIHKAHPAIEEDLASLKCQVLDIKDIGGAFYKFWLLFEECYEISIY